MKTKDKILKTSLRLFNAQGTRKITTNHIAAEMKISPGNLYYHYRNKEEIIRKIWAMLAEKMDVLWDIPLSDKPEKSIADFFSRFFRLFYEYRFFWIELATLLDADPELRRKYVQRNQRVLEKFEAIINRWIEIGIMIMPESPEDKQLLVENSWFIGQMWTNYCKIHNSKVTFKDMKRGIYRVFRLLKPYFIPEYQDKIESILESL